MLKILDGVLDFLLEIIDFIHLILVFDFYVSYVLFLPVDFIGYGLFVLFPFFL